MSDCDNHRSRRALRHFTKILKALLEIYLNKKNSGQVAAYLGLSQIIDRKLACSDSWLGKRNKWSETSDWRYAYEGKILINIDTNIHWAGSRIAHEHENKISQQAIEWFKTQY